MGPFDAGRLALSDIVLGTRDNAGSMPDGAPAIPIVPTTTRVFSASNPAWAFLRVYRDAGNAAQPADCHFQNAGFLYVAKYIGDGTIYFCPSMMTGDYSKASYEPLLTTERILFSAPA